MNKKIMFSVIGSILLVSNMIAQEKVAVITTNLGTMKAKLYEDVPNHVKAFSERAQKGTFDGTLFTRVIENFVIQGGAGDSRNAPPGARVGSGDRSSEIMPEFRTHHFHKKGALAAPRQGDDVNPEKKSDMSQFYIIHGKVYTNEELETLEKAKNQGARKKALDEFYYPVENELSELRHDNPQEYNLRVARISEQIDSVIRATPGHLFFTEEQKEAYTTVGGVHRLDGEYTVFGELIEGFDVLDKIATRPKDSYDRPSEDVRIISIKIE